MGKQQLLFIFLLLCVIGVVLSAGAILVQPSENIDHRQLLRAELMHLASEARAYRSRSFEEEGGDGTFLGLTATPLGISRLTPNPISPIGEFSIAANGNSECVQILAIGKMPGNNPRKPTTILMTVFPEGCSISTLN